MGYFPGQYTVKPDSHVPVIYSIHCPEHISPPYTLFTRISNYFYRCVWAHSLTVKLRSHRAPVQSQRPRTREEEIQILAFRKRICILSNNGRLLLINEAWLCGILNRISFAIQRTPQAMLWERLMTRISWSHDMNTKGSKEWGYTTPSNTTENVEGTCHPSHHH